MRSKIVGRLLPVCASCLVWQTVWAQNPATKQEPLLIPGVRGEQVRREVETSGKVQNVRLISSSFTRSDGRTLSSGEIVRIQKAALEASEGRSLPLTFDFQSAASGEYTGALRFATDEGDLTIPVVLKIKDPPLWPLVCLIGGLIVSIVVTWYAKDGRPRDRLILREANLRSEYGRDADRNHPLALHFIERGEGKMAESDAARGNSMWNEANAAMDAAEAFWHRWPESRSDWRALWTFSEDLKQQLTGYGAYRFAPALTARLDELARDAPAGAATDYRTRLSEIQRQVRDCDRMFRRGAEVQELWDGLAEPERTNRQHAVRRLLDRVGEYEPGNQEAYDGLIRELDAAAQEMEKLPRAATAKRFVGGALVAGPVSAALPNMAGLQVAAAAAGGALFRTRVFGFIGWAVAIALLSGAGFQELYQTKVTFGAEPWLDYFGVLAWGFGAEATRASVTNVLKNLGIG